MNMIHRLLKKEGSLPESFVSFKIENKKSTDKPLPPPPEKIKARVYNPDEHFERPGEENNNNQKVEQNNNNNFEKIIIKN